MNAKMKNDPAHYIPRASLAGSLHQKQKPIDDCVRQRSAEEERNKAGHIDARWYIDLSRSIS